MPQEIPGNIMIKRFKTVYFTAAAGFNEFVLKLSRPAAKDVDVDV